MSSILVLVIDAVLPALHEDSRASLNARVLRDAKRPGSLRDIAQRSRTRLRPSRRAPDRFVRREDRLRIRTSRLWVAGYPDLVAQWHRTRNVDLFPDEVRFGSPRRVWWKCAEGPDHEWCVPAYPRIRFGTRCPFCAGRRLSITNALATLFPALAAEWHRRKNGDLVPTRIVAGSKRSVWWKCAEGRDHEWRARVRDRAKGGGCPFCANMRLSTTNCLASVAPKLAREWHPMRNRGATPQHVIARSGRMAWWKCARGTDHVWLASIDARVRQGTGCPFCAGNRASVTNSLASRAPRIAREWDRARNGRLAPCDVTLGDSALVWWRCPKGPDHVWQQRVFERVRAKGCPFCLGRRVSKTNMLSARFPKIAAEWDRRRNGSRSPGDVTWGSSRLAWWTCARDPKHQWRARVRSRTMQGDGCPECARRASSLAARFPRIAAEWHPARNRPASPSEVPSASRHRAWWRCSRGHEWRAMVFTRTRKKGGCPACRRSR